MMAILIQEILPENIDIFNISIGEKLKLFPFYLDYKVREKELDGIFIYVCVCVCDVIIETISIKIMK